LAWKIDYVMSGRAGNKLLDSFSVERQPVGAGIIARANQGLRDHQRWMQAIGMLQPDVEKRIAILKDFDDPGNTGRKRRAAFQEAIRHTATEFHGLGIEMNQRYESDAVYAADEPEPMPVPEEALTKLQITTFPGRRLPHAWLNTRRPGKCISTIDLAGHGRFCLLTGPGGQAWKDAAKEVVEATGVNFVSYSIGWNQDFEDVYSDWALRREVEEDGCVLVRPDRFVAWRSSTKIEDCRGKLESVVRSIVSLA
jgi:hypothetical protein